MNEEMLKAEIAQLQSDLAIANKQIDGVFKSYRCIPYESAKHIGLQQLIDTRYITLEAHNEIVQRLVFALEKAYEEIESYHQNTKDI